MTMYVFKSAKPDETGLSMEAKTGAIGNSRQATGSSRLTTEARAFLGKPGAGIFIFLVVLLILLGISTPQILKPGNLMGILNQMVLILIPTFGITLVIIAGGLDLSVGSVLGLTGGIAAYLICPWSPYADRVRGRHSLRCSSWTYQWTGDY